MLNISGEVSSQEMKMKDLPFCRNCFAKNRVIGCLKRKGRIRSAHIYRVQGLVFNVKLLVSHHVSPAAWLVCRYGIPVLDLVNHGIVTGGEMDACLSEPWRLFLFDIDSPHAIGMRRPYCSIRVSKNRRVFCALNFVCTCKWVAFNGNEPACDGRGDGLLLCISKW